MKKVVIPGLVSAVAMFLAGMVINILTMKLFPGLMREYNNHFMFRSMKDPLMNLYYVQPVLTGLIMAWIWDKAKKIIKGKGLTKGVNFGLIYLLVILPGILMDYGTCKISLLMVISWLVGILVQGIVAGMVLAKMNK
jgi:membrane protease YdiL (CAAX protease family)